MGIKEILFGAQRGLPLPASFGQVLTIRLKSHDEETKKAILDIVRSLAQDIANNYTKCGLVAAFCPKLWGSWSGRDIPIHTEILDRKIKFRNTGGDVVLYTRPHPRTWRLRL
ncbi:uncharacterized protein LW94_1730 [Fusarium fujikuroi]|nr:uncharacterized protein LW94_1730 [Fusarium fujikuroi]